MRPLPALVVIGVAALGAGSVQAAPPQLDPARIYARSAAGVVDITVTSVVDTYFGQRQVEAGGSGFVLDAKGDIVTNEHVIDGAISITIRFSNGSKATAALVGSDMSTDVAVLRVSAAGRILHPLALGNSSGVKPGERVVAIGSPFGLQGTITEGIVSAVGRMIAAPDRTPIGGAIQTDAAINEGNSGGPLIDAGGKVIGVNAQINSRSGGNEGVGFAIPINLVRRVVTRLLSTS